MCFACIYVYVFHKDNDKYHLMCKHYLFSVSLKITQNVDWLCNSK